MKRLCLLLTSSLMFLSCLFSQTSDPGLLSLSREKVEAPLEFLSSDWTEGREAGTKGAYLASDYIAGLFKLYGIRPMGDMAMEKMSRERRMKGGQPESYRGYFQNFDMLTGKRKPGCELSFVRTTSFSSVEKQLVEGVDYRIRGISGTSETDAPVVFLGYGLKNEKLKTDPYLKTNVKGKIVFIVAGFPGATDTLSENYRTLVTAGSGSPGRLEKEKIETAGRNGALAVVRYDPAMETLVSTDPSNLPFFYDQDYYEGDARQDDYYLKKLTLPDQDEESSLPVIQINRSLAALLLGDVLDDMVNPDFRLGSFKPEELNGFRFHLKVLNDQQVIKVRNVLGYIEGENPTEAVLIGAHYDHVGKYNGFIFNGADDNASGTAGMLALARAFKEKGVKPAKTIIFAAWTGEEQGLWGSKYFVKNLPDSLHIVLNVNLDMISRTSIKDSTGHYLSFVYTRGHEDFEKIFTELNSQNHFNLQLTCKSEERPRGGSDFTPFAEQDIPVISLFTGLHKDYHMPDDEFEFVDMDKMVEIVRLTYLGVNRILDENTL